MKILLFSTYRTGSHTLMDWLCGELGLTKISELEDINVDDNFIVKRTLDHLDFDFEEECKNYDKVIILYRKDTLKQAESNFYATRHRVWHRIKYELSQEDIDGNFHDIKSVKGMFDTNNLYFNNVAVDNCLKVTYEDIFYEGIGQKEIEDYLEFKSKNKLQNLENKLRVDNNTLNLQYQEIIKKDNTEYQKPKKLI